MKIDTEILVLGSSNTSKIKEYQEFGLNIKTKQVPDLKEVNGTELEVILHKIKDLNEENVILEDSTLTVSGADIGVNTKWLIEDLKNNPKYNGREAKWKIFLGFTQNKIIYVFESQIEGIISQEKKNDKAFGFDSVFIPSKSNETLFELKNQGKKDLFSARKNAIVKLFNKNPDYVMALRDLVDWKGSYQNE